MECVVATSRIHDDHSDWVNCHTRAYIHFLYGDYDRCIKDASMVIQIKPRNARSHWLRAKAKFASRDFIGATIDGFNSCWLKWRNALEH